MLAWVIGAIVPAAALCIAALLAEQATRERQRPGRWIWIAAMSLSILLPVMAPWLPVSASVRLPLLHLPLAGARPTLATFPFDALGPPLWLALSIATLLAVACGALLVQRRSRTWRRTRIGNQEVYIAREAGPAVFGLWQPRIVVPEWLERAAPQQRELAIAHEQSHLLARDPQLLACALVLVSIMPWNLPLWWQLRRLRRAIEVDCDQRVLRAGGDLVEYGETLIQLSQHQSRLAGLMAATSQPRSFLERRIHIMSSEISRWSRVSAALWICLAVGAVAVAAELTPSPATPTSPAVRPGAPNSTSATAAKVQAEIAAAREKEVKESAEDHEGDADSDDAEESANEAMHDADEQMAEAEEAMHDAEKQKAEAMAAKREAEAASAEARAKKQAAEAAAAH
jgi:bla regulator protein BlaR1